MGKAAGLWRGRAMQLILMRHPPIVGDSGICYGRHDLAADAEAIPACLAALSAWSDWPVFSSPALRCRQLAEAFSSRTQFWPHLHELDFGLWEGMPWDALPRAELDAWAADIWHYRPGGGENAAMLRFRWEYVLECWREMGLVRAVVITHAGVIRMALAQTGVIAESERWIYPIEYGKPYELVV